MSESPFTSVYIKVGTQELDHPWYECEPGGGCRLLDGDPATFAAVRQLVVPRECAAVLYRRPHAGADRWGVYWGPTPVGQSDVRGRPMLFRLLAELSRPSDAADFLAGVLLDWWPNREIGVGELGTRASEAVMEGNATSDLIPAYLAACLDRWQIGDRPPAPPDVAANEPRHAVPTDERLGELYRYLRNGLTTSHWAAKPAAGFDPGVIVTTGVVLSRFAGVWRAVTDQSDGVVWSAYTARALESPPTTPDPESPKRRSLFTRLKDTLWVEIDRPGAADGNKGTGEWIRLLLHGGQAERREAVRALVYRATQREEDKTRRVRDELLGLLKQPGLDRALIPYVLDTLRQIAAHTVHRLGKPGLDAITGLLNLAQGAGVGVRQAAGAVRRELGHEGPEPSSTPHPVVRDEDEPIG